MPLKNSEARRAYNSRYYRENRGAIRASNERWKGEHPERVRTYAQRRREKDQKLIESLRGACIECGATDDVCFHHPREKLRNVSHMKNCSRKAILLEIGRCVTLCRSCHIKLHDPHNWRRKDERVSCTS